jgi:hypothetical protein
MSYLKLSAAIILALSVSACSRFDPASRAAKIDADNFAQSVQTLERNYAVAEINYMVPENLSVSEGNGFYPTTDVVWRGDPIGNRPAQIGAMFQEAITRNAPVLQGDLPVIVDLTLIRFHGVTERTRFSIGGVYDIKFDLTIRDALTGFVIEPTRRVHVDLAAPGGVGAILAEQRGQTEKVRVTNFLAIVMHGELTGQTAL